VSAHVHLPSLDGATAWLGSEPLGPGELRGKVVLVNFWTWTCINWLRQEPYVRAWSQAYRADGLIVIGVHTPEFSFEHDVDGVRRAIEVRAIDYPVAVDNDYAVWDAFANHYWPALYFADRNGIIRDQHFGEGRYEQSERVIQELLGVEREPVAVAGTGVEAAADWDNLGTPEIYLDRGRGVPVEAGGSISCPFHARDAHAVLNRSGPEPIPFRVRLDGEPPGAAHGVDTDEDGNGLLDDGRMYQLVRQHDAIRERELEITFAAPGAEAYSFTFG
jgi:thiol-disulfide isomerase/thioredoxin